MGPELEAESGVRLPDLAGAYTGAPRDEGESQSADLLQVLSAAVYTTDADKRIEEELRKRTQDLEDFFENGVVALHWVASDGTILRANQAELDLLGYAREDYVGHHIAEFHADRPVIDDILARLSRGEKLDKYPARLRAKDGSIKHVQITSDVRFQAGEFLYTRCFSVDVTAQERVQAALRESEERLSAELAAAQQLQRISAELVHEQDVQSLYAKLVDAAAAIMRSDCASMQMLHPERGDKGELRLLAARAFNPQATKFWEWVRADSGCTCGMALRTRERAIATDVETCDFLAGTQDRVTYLQAGIRAVQSTPLLSRSSRLLGMLSTHWRERHEPSETDLQRFDVLARQAADLIERTQTETALRENEERFRALVNASSQIVWTANAEGVAVEDSPTWRAFTGQTYEEWRDSGWLDALHPEDRERVSQAWRGAVEGKTPIEIDYRVRHVSGEWRWTTARATPVFAADGALKCYVGMNTDITERKRAEEALRLSQEQLHIALTASDTGTFSWNPYTGEFLAFDENLKRLFGFAPGEQVRVTEDLIARVHRDDVPRLVAAINRCREGADFEMEFRVIHPDGSIHWHYGRAKMERDAEGNPTYLVGTCTDVTQRTQSEYAARETAQRFLFMAETMPQKIFSATANGDVDYFNRQWLEFTGLTFTQIRSSGWTQFIHPDDVEENIRLWRHSIETGEPFEFVHRFRRADGAYRWHLSRARAMRDASGAVLMWIGSNTEIHEQKEMAETLRQREEALHLLLREMNHRVKNLFALAGSVVTLSARSAGTPKELAEAVRERLAALARAHDLTLPDVTEGGEKPDWATSLPALVRTIISPYVSEGDARVIIEGPDVPIGGNAVTGMALLLHEIATNAAKYGALSTESGHVDVSWSVWKGELLLAWREHGGPPLNGQPEKEGFGSLLARLTVTGQLAGKISRDWNPEGLTVNLSAPMERITN